MANDIPETAEQYIEIVRTLGAMIEKSLTDIQSKTFVSQNDRDGFLARAAEVVETISSLRGDSSVFDYQRPSGLTKYQKEMYAIEDSARTKLVDLGYKYPGSVRDDSTRSTDQSKPILYAQGSDSVRIVLRDKLNTDKFLILSETDDPDNLKLPGGKFEAGENEFTAAIRELAEELSLKINRDQLGDCVELLNDDGISKRYIFHVSVDPSIIEPTDEIAQIDWVGIDSIPSVKNQGHILAAVKSKDA